MMEYIKQVRELDDQDPGSTLLMGYGYFVMGQFDKVIPELEKTLEILRKWGKEYIEYFDPSVFGLLGYSYHKTGQFKKEKKLYKEWEHYTPDMPWLFSRQAIFSLDEKDTVMANRYIAKYISLMRNLASNAAVAKGLAQLYSEAGMPDRAERYYREAVALEPENAGRLKDLADFLTESKRNLNEVSELMDKAMGMAKNKGDYYIYLNTKGWGLYKQGKNNEALEILQKTWDESPYKFYSIKSHLEEVKNAVAGQKTN
jgi:Tfp pilus assembly protein PilF